METLCAIASSAILLLLALFSRCLSLQWALSEPRGRLTSRRAMQRLSCASDPSGTYVVLLLNLLNALALDRTGV